MSDPFLAVITPVSRPGGGIDNSLPGEPGEPDQGLPGDQPGIDNSLPGRGRLPPLPSTLPLPPAIWPGVPVHPLPVPPPGSTLPEPPPGAVWPPLPPNVEGKLLVVVFISGVGHRWAIIDTTLHIDGSPADTPMPK
jgi:hypothetical protein